MLGQAGRLSERQRVKPRLSLPLIRIRYFVVSLIPWSEARSRPPSPQNMFENRPCFRTLFMRTLVNFIAGTSIKWWLFLFLYSILTFADKMN